ncbi:hypothetical protein JZ751_012508 [Albula glossodonta]|uniref:Uncharacterized protein n=1 Tax=Albula glossodonta TaxID=121402 RepID=A0A8T2P336_9TELE|nr:hypothetical protein JZ751_012508 [Albula glossodonta]
MEEREERGEREEGRLQGGVQWKGKGTVKEKGGASGCQNPALSPCPEIRHHPLGVEWRPSNRLVGRQRTEHTVCDIIRELSKTRLKPHSGRYEKTEDASEKTSLADQEDARLIFINQPQLTKFCSNRVSSTSSAVQRTPPSPSTPSLINLLRGQRSSQRCDTSDPER